jgi:hypothetical protein
VVMETDEGDAVIWMVDDKKRGGDKDKDKKKRRKDGEESEEELNLEPPKDNEL